MSVGKLLSRRTEPAGELAARMSSMRRSMRTSSAASSSGVAAVPCRTMRVPRKARAMAKRRTGSLADVGKKSHAPEVAAGQESFQPSGLQILM